MDHRKLAKLLGETPPVRLQLLTLAGELLLPEGGLDIEAAARRLEEIEEATEEARLYARATRELSGRMRWLMERRPG